MPLPEKPIMPPPDMPPMPIMDKPPMPVMPPPPMPPAMPIMPPPPPMPIMPPPMPIMPPPPMPPAMPAMPPPMPPRPVVSSNMMPNIRLFSGSIIVGPGGPMMRPLLGTGVSMGRPRELLMVKMAKLPGVPRNCPRVELDPSGKQKIKTSP